MTPRPFPPAHPHGDLLEVFPDVFLITGSFPIGPMRISRNMVVLRQGERLVLVNTVRLDEARLAALDALGRVTDVIRLAGFHGSDDPFYRDRYGCTVHAIRGQTYFTGLDPRAGEIYFEPDALLEADSPLPIDGASLVVFSTSPPEALLRIPAGGGTLISGDSLQNWATADAFFDEAGAQVMARRGFIAPHQLGRGWIVNSRPDHGEIAGILSLGFANVLPGHGAPVIGGAPEKYRPAIAAYLRS